jgi:RNA-binding protein YlmH
MISQESNLQQMYQSETVSNQNHKRLQSVVSVLHKLSRSILQATVILETVEIAYKLKMN